MDKEHDYESFYKELRQYKTNIIANIIANPNSQPTSLTFASDIIEGIYTKTLIDNQLNLNKLTYLDRLSYLENYLLPFYTEDTSKATSKYTFSIILMLNYKFEQNLYAWDLFSTQDYKNKFKIIFENAVDLELAHMTYSERLEFFIFLVHCYKYVEEDFIRSVCMPYIGSALWSQLSKPFLKNLFLKYPNLIDSYKKYLQKADFTNKQKILFVSWVNEFWKSMNDSTQTKQYSENQKRYYEKFIEFLIDLLSQIPTRRQVKYVLLDSNFLIKAKLSSFYQSSNGELFKKLIDNLQFFQDFEIDEDQGVVESCSRVTLVHYDKMAQFQMLLFKNYKDRLSAPAVKNINNIDSRKSLIEILDYLSDDEVLDLCDKLWLSYPTETQFQEMKFLPEDLSYTDFIAEVLLDHLIQKDSFAKIIKSTALYPTDKVLWDPNLLHEELYEGKAALPLPKLNMQFLSIQDYLYRNFNLFRLESAFQIRKDLEDVVSRVQPLFDSKTGKFMSFKGWARMASEVKGFTIHEVATPKIGENYPSRVLAEVKYSTSDMATYVRKEWEELKTHDILFLVSFEKINKKEEEEEMKIEDPAVEDKKENKQGIVESWGIKYVRGCEVMSQYDENRNKISNSENNVRRIAEGTSRSLQILLDPVQYKQDLETISKKEGDIYGSFKLLVRRKSKENNFKAILNTLMEIMNTPKLSIPEWLEEMILGYGDAESEEFKQILREKLHKEGKPLNFIDTFLDDDHYKEVFIGNDKIPEEDKKNTIPGEFSILQASEHDTLLSLDVDYNLPYLEESFKKINIKRRTNKIRFTDIQVNAINSAIRESLTLIEGPPGTGKTDVAVQIMNLIYHNFPNEKTLIITHSNHALNDLFEKITQLNINQR